LRAQRPEDTLVLERGPKTGGEVGAWLLRGPIEGPVDPGRMEAMLEALYGLRAAGFAPQGAGPKELGLDAPELILVLEGLPPGEGASQTIRVSQESQGWRYASTEGGEDRIYKVPSHPFLVFFDPGEEYLEESL